jgi:hypothetical protein
MARLFASFFGAVAFLVVILRGLLEGRAVEATLESACLALVIFSLVGGWLGWTADGAVRQAVETQVEAVLGSTASGQTASSQSPAR